MWIFSIHLDRRPGSGAISLPLIFQQFTDGARLAMRLSTMGLNLD
jgi:hypothetical protein